MTTLLDFLRTSEPSVSVWDYVSASRLNLWAKCPLAFRRRYIDDIQPAPSVSMFVGKVVHGVLEHVYRCRTVGTIFTEGDLPAFVESAWSRSMEFETSHFDDDTHEQKCRQQVHDLTAMYLREIDIESETPLAVEKRYETQLVDPLTGEDLGILWMLRSGARYKDVPKYFPSGSTCWRRVAVWGKAGVFLRLWQILLAKLDKKHRLNWKECIADGTFSSAKKGGARLVRPKKVKARK